MSGDHNSDQPPTGDPAAADPLATGDQARPDAVAADTAVTSVHEGDAPVDEGDLATPVRGVTVPPSASPLTELSLSSGAVHAELDDSRVPPRPPLPTDPAQVIREQWRARRGEIESHVSHARDQFDQANERIKQRTGRDLLLAIVIGVAFGGALVASLLFIKWLFIPIALAAGLLGTYELARALRAGGRRIDVVPQLIAALGVMLSGISGQMWLGWVVLIAAVAFIAVWRLIAQMVVQDGRTYGDVLADVVVGAFVQVYVPFLTSLAIILLLRDGGEWWVLSFIAIAVAADTCAYIAGLSFGRHPMAPRISPKKTWEGFAGAVVGSLLVGALLAFFLLHLPWWTGLILGAAVLLSATLGDLGESMLKRDLGIKDMSSWLPGHGGLLDRLDSILPSTVPALALSYLFSGLVMA